MGLILTVYRNAEGYDCTNGGVTSKFNKVCVTNVEGPFDPSPDAPAVELVGKSFSFGKSVNLVPVDLLEKKSWTMFGGNYATTSDSRFSKAVEKMLGVPFWSGAVPVHDRVE